MDRAHGYGPYDAGSIPARGAIFNFPTLVGRFGEIRMLDPDASQGALATWQCSPASAGTLSNEGRLVWAHGVGLGTIFTQGGLAELVNADGWKPSGGEQPREGPSPSPSATFTCGLRLNGISHQTFNLKSGESYSLARASLIIG